MLINNLGFIYHIKDLLLNIEVINLIINVISAVGTFVLGALAGHQNRRLGIIEHNRAAIETSCNIYIQADDNPKDDEKLIKLSNEYDNENYKAQKYLYIVMTNHSDAFLKRILIDFGDIKFCSHITLSRGERKRVKIALPDNIDNDKINIKYISCYDTVTYADFELTDRRSNINEKSIKYYHFYGIHRK